MLAARQAPGGPHLHPAWQTPGVAIYDMPYAMPYAIPHAIPHAMPPSCSYPAPSVVTI